MSRSPVRVSEPPRPRTQATAARLAPPDPRKVPYTVCGTFRTHRSRTPGDPRHDGSDGFKVPPWIVSTPETALRSTGDLVDVGCCRAPDGDASTERIGRCRATPHTAEIRDGAARLAELRLRAVRRAARQRRGRRRARSPTRACSRSRRRLRGRGAMRARTASNTAPVLGRIRASWTSYSRVSLRTRNRSARWDCCFSAKEPSWRTDSTVRSLLKWTI